MNEEFVRRVRDAAQAADNRRTRILLALAEIAVAPTRASEQINASPTDAGRRDPSTASDPSPDERMVVISMQELAELIEAVAQPLSFAEALREAGFVPATAPKPTLRRGNARNPLRRYRADEA